MKATRSSNKRKHPSSSSDLLTGIVTRSKSAIFLHRNRSGRARLDRDTRPGHNSKSQNPGRLPEIPRLSSEEALDDDIGRISIKDLRTRRIFSPALIHSDGCSDGSKLQSSGAEGIEPFVSFFPYNAQNEKFEEPRLSEKERNADSCKEEQISNEDGVVSCGLADSVEDCVQTTPPDAQIFCKSEIEDNGEYPTWCGLQIKDQTKTDMSYKSSYKDRTEGLIPCSRLKLFKTPNSFSYRRLLPFLMDITKDNSNSFEMHPPHKIQCPLEARPLPPMCASPSQDTSMEGNKGHMSSSPQIEKNSETNSEIPPVDSAELLIARPCVEHPQNPHLVSLTDDETTPITSDSINSTVGIAAMKCSRLEWDCEAINSCPGTDPSTELLCPSPTTPQALQVKGVALESPSLLSEEAEKCCISPLSALNDDANCIESISLCHDSSQFELYSCSERPLTGLRQGILKRNPRGCRGLCTCLNCASFRLHAERAFEFSQNQMQDAEEVVVELMKELSYLRNMLEKSVGGSKNYAALQGSQVEDACMKASKAEEWARGRLKQMNYDLGIHCRMTSLQRPMVRFANNVEEKLIPTIRDSPKNCSTNETEDSG